MIGLVLLSLVGCFSFESQDMIYFRWGLRSGTSTIKRHASRDLVTFSPGRTDRRKGKAAAKLLRTAIRSVRMPQFFRQRWAAATDPGQYEDIGEDIRAMRGHSRCLAMRMKAAWMTWGYDWKTYGFGHGGCTWGHDPVPQTP
ncbi:MAG: hypothetical protein JWM47_2919 [Acidimicrobiales bacterium]|nr:hypothetical protein [Acidimicrobiales bacterium]